MPRPSEPDAAPGPVAPRAPDAPRPASEEPRSAHVARLESRFGAGRMPGRYGVVVALIAAMLAMVLGAVLAVLGLAAPEGYARTATSLVIQDAAFLSGIAVVALLAGPIRRRDIGLQAPPRPWLAAGLTTLAFVGYLGLAALVLALLGASDATDTNPQKLGITDGLVPALVVGGVATTITPVAEEVLFRGLLFGGLARTIARFAPSPVAVGLAAVAMGALFGLAHAGATTPVLMVPLAMFGIVLALLTWATRSLVPAIAVHSVNNSFAVGSAAEFSTLGIATMTVVSLLVLALGLWLVRVIGRRVGPLGRSAAGPELARA